MVEIITIGNEVLNGRTLNGNAAFIGAELQKLGFSVRRVTTIPDSYDDIKDTLSSAFQRSDIIFTTGGLGPTHDDMTCEAICRYIDTQTVLNERALHMMKTRYRSRDRSMPKGNEKQAYIPKGSQVMLNSIGTAPGFYIAKDGKYIFSMPGVPHEMQKMFLEEALPVILEHFPKKPRIIKKYRTTGIPESLLFNKLDRISWLEKTISTAFLPSAYGVDLILEYPPDFSIRRIEEIDKNINKKIKPHIYSYGEETLEEVIAQLLIKKNKTLAVAESCTGGLVSHRVTDVPGSSSYFLYGVTAYSNIAKMNILKVSKATIERFGAVSEQCAREMAFGLKECSGADITLATTGIAGPTGDTDLKPLGLVYVACCCEKSCEVKRFIFKDQRDIHKKRASQAVLALLWKCLE